jgi:uncharacterized protein (DUF2062 family)
MLDRLKRLLPSHESIASNRWLRWLGPTLLHRSLWHMSRRGVAVGAAIGVFFAFVTPIAQIPLSAGLSVVLRANVAVAIAATLVNTPPTFGPVYYAAWRVGSWMLGEEANEARSPTVLRAASDSAEAAQAGTPTAVPSSWRRYWNTVQEIGKPLLLGAALFAVVFSALAYMLVNLVWHWRVRQKRLRRLRERLSRQRAR